MDSIDRRGALALITAAALAGCAAAREQGGSDFGRDLAAIEAKAQGQAVSREEMERLLDSGRPGRFSAA